MKITEIFVLLSAIMIFIVVLNLVRLRRLREEYSWLWLAAALFYLVMALKPKLISKLSGFLGITNSITAFTFFSLLFIVLILIHYSVRLSRLTTQMKDVTQQIALIDGDQLRVNRSLTQDDGDELIKINSQGTDESALPLAPSEEQQPGV
jgi:hypothetical protein